MLKSRLCVVGVTPEAFSTSALSCDTKSTPQRFRHCEEFCQRLARRDDVSHGKVHAQSFLTEHQPT